MGALYLGDEDYDRLQQHQANNAAAPVAMPATSPASSPAQPPAPRSMIPTTADISSPQAGNGRYPSLTLADIGSIAKQSGHTDEGARAAMAIAQTEGGLTGAAGDSGQSFGPFQFYTGGQLANFAQQNGMTMAAAGEYVRQHPAEAAQWALRPGGYLGNAIRRGSEKGLTGADLATYAQDTGQVSVTPERAGQNYDALFGGGPGTIPLTRTQPIGVGPQTDIFSAARQTLQQSVSAITGGLPKIQTPDIFAEARSKLQSGLSAITEGQPQMTPEPSTIGEVDIFADARAKLNQSVKQITMPSDPTNMVPSTPEMAQAAQEGLAPIAKPIGDALGAAGSAIGETWKVAGEAVAPYNVPTRLSNSMLGYEQLNKENAALYDTLSALQKRYNDGDRTLLPQIKAAQAAIHAKIDVQDQEEAAKRHPDYERAQNFNALAEGAIAAGIAPTLASGPVRQIAAAAIDPLGQAIGSGLQAVGPALRLAKQGAKALHEGETGAIRLPGGAPEVPTVNNFEPMHMESGDKVHLKGNGFEDAATVTPEVADRHNVNMEKIRAESPVLDWEATDALARRYGADQPFLDALARREGVPAQTVKAIKQTITDIGAEIEAAELSRKAVGDIATDAAIFALKTQEFDAMGILNGTAREIARAMNVLKSGPTEAEARGAALMFAQRQGAIQNVTPILETAAKTGVIKPEDLAKLQRIVDQQAKQLVDMKGPGKGPGLGPGKGPGGGPGDGGTGGTATTPKPAPKVTPQVAAAAEKAAPDPELREFLDELYKQRAASARHDEPGVQAAQKRMDELMDGFLDKARAADDEAKAAKEEAQRKLVAEEGVDALGDPYAEKVVDQDKIDQRVMNAIQQRVNAIVAKERAPDGEAAVDEVRQLVAKAFGHDYNSAAEQNLATNASKKIEAELQKTLGKAWQSVVGEHVTRLVKKLGTGGYPDEIYFARAETAIDAMVKQRPDLAKAGALLKARIQKAEARSAFSQASDVQSMESNALRITAQERVAKIQALVKSMGSSSDVRAYAADLLTELRTLGTESRVQARKFTETYNKSEVRKVMGADMPKPGTPEHDAAIAEFAKIDFTDPRAITLFAWAIRRPDFWQNVRIYRIGAMLTGPVTHMVNIIGNAIMTGWGPTYRLGAGAVESVVTLGGRTRQQTAYMSQATAELGAIAGGVGPAWTEAWRTLQSGVSSHAIRDLGRVQGESFKGVNPILKTALRVGSGSDWVLRSLAAGDDFFRTLNESMVLAGEAERYAKIKGLKVTDILDNLVDHPEVYNRVAKESERRVLQTPLDGIFEALQSARQHPLVGVLIPFLQTNANIYRVGMTEMTPYNVIKDVGKGILPGADSMVQAAIKTGDTSKILEARLNTADARGQALMGSMVMTWAGSQALGGTLSGSGPLDPATRAELMATGWQPYSVKIGDTWWDYKRFLGPAFVPVALAANIVESTQYGTQEKSVQDGMVKGLGMFTADLAKVFYDQTGLQGLASFIGAVQMAQITGDWTGQVGNVARSNVLSFRPQGGMGSTLARAFDPNTKDPGDIMQSLYASYPGLSFQVPNKIDVLGNTMPTHQEGGKAILPFKGSQEKPSPVISAYQQLRAQGQDSHLGQVSGTIEGVKLTPEESTKYQKLAGQFTTIYVKRLMDSPTYKYMNAATRARELTAARDEARTEARNQIKGIIGETPFKVRQVNAQAGGNP